MIAGVILAAGAGTRIGHPKALLEAGAGESFLSRACALLQAAGADPVVAVITPGLSAADGAVASGRVRLVVNPDPSRGQLSSLQAAIASFHVEPEAAIVLPVDVPLVRAETVRALVARWRETRAPVVRPVSGARHGHPVIFDRAVFGELLRAAGAEGAKPVVRAHASAAGDVMVEDEGAFLDVDTVEDYRRAFNKLPRTVRVR